MASDVTTSQSSRRIQVDVGGAVVAGLLCFWAEKPSVTLTLLDA